MDGRQATEREPSGDGARPHRSAAPAPHVAEDEQVVHHTRAVRLAYMARSLLAQIEQVELDEAARHRLAVVFNEAVAALRELLSEELQAELDRLTFELPADPTSPEVRVAQAQLVGWLDGLFHGIRTTLIAHQLATEEELARAYQRGLEAAGAEQEGRTTGSYL
jgi:hypothetical protein